MQRTKIVVTLGPSCRTETVLRQVIEAGASVFRMNFSHGSAEEHRANAGRVRKLARQLRREIMIFGDLPGPKIRLGEIEDSPLMLKEGENFFLTPRTMKGNARGASVGYASLLKDLKHGDRVVLNDGAVVLRVEKILSDRAECSVEAGGEIASRKGVNFPGVQLSARSLTAKDREWIRFAVEEKLDALALSFVRKAGDVVAARKLVQSHSATLPIIAKIEKHEAVEHLEEIVAVADAAMAARGDLGVEVPLELVPGIQKRLLKICNRAGKPVITATQMLESMIHSARPTRAEVSDIANAILDGTDAVMLSGETAVGAHPVEAVRVMARVAQETERLLLEASWLNEFAGTPINGSSDEAISHSVFRIAQRVGATAIFCLTLSGSTARRIARYRPPIPIYAFSERDETLRTLQMSWGVQPVLGFDLSDVPDVSTEAALGHAIALAQKGRLVQKHDVIVAAAGMPFHKAGITNMIRVIEI